MVPASNGDTTQLAAIEPTFGHSTTSKPIPIEAKPTMAPTMECVVETGQPKYDEISNQVPADRRADIIPKTKRSGLEATTPESMIPFRIVDVTSPPAR